MGSDYRKQAEDLVLGFVDHIKDKRWMVEITDSIETALRQAADDARKEALLVCLEEGEAVIEKRDSHRTGGMSHGNYNKERRGIARVYKRLVENIGSHHGFKMNLEQAISNRSTQENEG